MKTAVEIIRTLVILGALAALACGCKERSGSQPGGGREHPEDVSAEGATPTDPASPPALWEPVDKSFTGCESG